MLIPIKNLNIKYDPMTQVNNLQNLVLAANLNLISKSGW